MIEFTKAAGPREKEDSSKVSGFGPVAKRACIGEPSCPSTRSDGPNHGLCRPPKCFVLTEPDDQKRDKPTDGCPQERPAHHVARVVHTYVGYASRRWRPSGPRNSNLRMAPAKQTPGGERSPSIAVVSAVDLLLRPSASRVNGLRSLRHGRRRVLIGIMVDDDGDEVERAAVSFCLRGSRPKRRSTRLH
jgi:hypothetical protein